MGVTVPPPSSESANIPLVVTLISSASDSLRGGTAAIPCVENLLMMSGGAGGVWIYRLFN